MRYGGVFFLIMRQIEYTVTAALTFNLSSALSSGQDTVKASINDVSNLVRRENPQI